MKVMKVAAIVVTLLPGALMAQIGGVNLDTVQAGPLDNGKMWTFEYPPAGLDVSTPLNFISTADTYGGNSGSPAVTRDLELVGLNFDRNIDGLSRDFIYLPERGRNVMVDARAISTTLDVVYDADRIVQELRTGMLFGTEAEADSGR